MNLDYIFEFLSLAQELNFHKVSEQHNISVATLSKHIHELEDYLGQPLFVRTTRHVELTEFGEEFFHKAQRFYRSYQTFMEPFQTKATEQTHLSIATTLSIMHYCVPEIFSSFIKDHPEFTLNINETKVDKARSLLQLGHYHFAFLPSVTKNDAEFCSINIATDTLAVILPASGTLSLLAKNGKVALKRLHGINIHYNPDSIIYSLLSSACVKEGFIPNLESCASGSPLLIGAVVNKHGIAIMEKQEALAYQSPDLVIADLEPPIAFYINCLYEQDIVDDLNLHCFQEYVLKFAKKSDS